MTEYKFSIPEHSKYLAGYLDAVGRELTNDEELIFLSSNYFSCSQDPEVLLGYPIVCQHPITRWSSEFGSLIEGEFGIGGRSRLGFYLVDYIDWFRQFTDDAECFKVASGSMLPLTLFEAVYVLQWRSGERVVLSFVRSGRAGP